MTLPRSFFLCHSFFLHFRSSPSSASSSLILLSRSVVLVCLYTVWSDWLCSKDERKSKDDEYKGVKTKRRRRCGDCCCFFVSLHLILFSTSSSYSFSFLSSSLFFWAHSPSHDHHDHLLFRGEDYDVDTDSSDVRIKETDRKELKRKVDESEVVDAVVM